MLNIQALHRDGRPERWIVRCDSTSAWCVEPLFALYQCIKKELWLAGLERRERERQQQIHAYVEHVCKHGPIVDRFEPELCAARLRRCDLEPELTRDAAAAVAVSIGRQLALWAERSV